MSGYYGCGNAGDEAVLSGIAGAFRQVAGDSARLLPLSQDPAATRTLHGLDARYRMDRRIVKATLAEADLLISGGGSLLQDTSSVRSLIYYLWIVRMALRMGKPVMFYAQGMGPFNKAISRWLVRRIASRVSYITVRDEESASLLRTIGVTGPPIEVTADPAFALRQAPRAEVDACWRGAEQPASGRPKIGVALRPWGGRPEAQAAECARLVWALNVVADVVMLPMQLPGDAVFSEDVARRAGLTLPVLKEPASPAALLGLVGDMDAVVAMRLHALIFAARMAVPPFALTYDPKVDSLMRVLGLDDSLAPWTGFSADAVAGSVASLLAHRAERSEALHGRAGDLERLALRNAEIALSLVR
ncbi:MAG TPA: polysaccharide pyruvyl transferase CsaB [Chthonomonadaceae bacterium]|nr:polysaccharide pyruvyl transferase CsaB [Chthonomonadaceae bacterium]